MSWFNSLANTLTGTLSPDQVNAITSQVSGPQQSAYQIGGAGYLQGYQNQMNGISGQVGANTTNLGGATAGTMANQQQLGNYEQNIALGNGTTAADQLLQNSQAQGARQLQAGVTSAQGLNPALALRQMYSGQATQQGNIAGQAAQQKLQEQQQYAQMASANQQQQYQEQFNNVQQQYANTMSNLQAQKDIANNVFSANAQQTTFNTEYQQNQEAYQQWMAQQQLAAQQAQANSVAALTGGLIKGGLTAAGAAIGGPMGAMAGASLGSGFGGGGQQGYSNMSPAQMQMMYNQSQGGGSSGIPDANYQLSNPAAGGLTYGG